MMWGYLVALCVSLFCLGLIDRRLKLALWHDARRTLHTIGIAIAVFIVWDLLGIRLGIFFHGGSDYTLPLRIVPEFPIEELFFLTLLCYSALLLWRGGEKIWPRI